MTIQDAVQVVREAYDGIDIDDNSISICESAGTITIRSGEAKATHDLIEYARFLCGDEEMTDRIVEEMEQQQRPR
jgi:hypothetical protein